MLLLTTLIIAMSSILYELALAQLSSALLGGTIMQYSLTIGFYVFSLGLGSLFYGKFLTKTKDKNMLFLIIETCIIIISALFPFLIYFLHQDINYVLLYILIYTSISLIGFISGIELPLLMDVYNNEENSYSGKILSFDFFGTFIGTILFPVLLIKLFHIITIPFYITFINLIAIIIIFKRINNKVKWAFFPLYFLIVIICFYLESNL